MMQQDNSVGNKAYIKAIKTLQLIFAASYRDGGWLPGGREMAKKLGISHSTYCKAITRLENESFVKSYPCKGHYVIPEVDRCHKIGIVLRDGSDSPFVEECDSFLAGIKTLRSGGFDIQFIQSTRPEQLYDNAIAHGIDGMIWIQPSPTSVPYTREIAASGDIPLVVISWGQNSDIDFAACCIRKDYNALVTAQVNAILQRGHKRVTVVGYAREIWTIDVLSDLKKAGIKTDFYETGRNDGAERFSDFLLNEKPTAVISCGGTSTTTFVFNAFSQITLDARPDLLLSETEPSKLPPLIGTGVAFMMVEYECELGLAAATLLIRHILAGEPLADVNVGVSNSGLKFYNCEKQKN